ncbi:ATPase [Lutibacter sp. B2]|nr:ATPase [Lutibacter sp. B2]
MNRKGYIKQVFPGGNTAKGFFSYYDNIIGAEANRIFVIKGGPGVGKSYFMKKIGYKMAELGYDVEFHQCSSDNNSLDGVVIPKLKIAMMDGTSPHIVDPKYPGAVDEILNFGAFWDRDAMEKNKDEIITSTTKIGKLFKRAYRFFAAAKSLRDDMEVVYEEALDKQKFNTMVEGLKREIFNNHNEIKKEGKVRHLFGSALTPNGLTDYYESIIGSSSEVYYVDGTYVTGISNLMNGIVSESVKKGFDVEVYYEPLDEKNIETIVIPSLNITFTTSKKYEDKNYKKVDFNGLMDGDLLKEYKEALLEDEKLVNLLIESGVKNISRAKKEHDILESFYIPNINFDKADHLREEIIKIIVSYDQ